MGPMTYAATSPAGSMPTGMNALSVLPSAQMPAITVSAEMFEKAKLGNLTQEEINWLKGQPSTTMASGTVAMSTAHLATAPVSTQINTNLATQPIADLAKPPTTAVDTNIAEPTKSSKKKSSK